MSSSATSTADSDSVLSRGEKRALSPVDSPQPKKPRHDPSDQNNWDLDSSSAPPVDDDKTIDHSKLQLPSILTSFEEPHPRRGSLPDTSRQRHSPYPQPSTLRHTYTPSAPSITSYTFPQVDQTAGDRLAKPKVMTNFVLGVDGAYADSLNSGLSNGTTPSSTAFTTSNYNSPLSSDYQRPPGLAYYENETWNDSPPPGIVRPSSTPGHLGSPAVKYEEGLRHPSFGPLSQPQQMFAGSGRISGQQDRRSVPGIKNEWAFSNSSPDFPLPPTNNQQYSPNMNSAPPSIAVSNSPPRVSPSVSTSSLVDRPPRKRGKLPKETTDYLKAWLHRHSDHPYPSEEEKKQLCNATGLSMSQVSNWMINVSISLFFAPLRHRSYVSIGSQENSCSRTPAALAPNNDGAVSTEQPLVVQRGGPIGAPRLNAGGCPSIIPPNDLADHVDATSCWALFAQLYERQGRPFFTPSASGTSYQH